MTVAGWTDIASTLAPGRRFMLGDDACAEGAIAAGCDFYAGYPITPASEVMEHVARRFRVLDERVFVQMEDEIASIASVIGASWAGARAMTATSGPGLSLMLENIGYAIMTETPLVVVDIQRAGPSTGQATRPAQGDVMQVRWGASGDYEIIAISPWSVADMYRQTVRAFNLAEQFRVPVFVLGDEGVGHLREPLDIPERVRVYRRSTEKAAPFGDAPVPPMPRFGDGAQLLVTGSTHDAQGYRRTADSQAQQTLVDRFSQKIQAAADEIIEVEELLCDDDALDVLLIAYGFTARSALRAAQELRQTGVNAGLLRLSTLWPFAARQVAHAAERARHVLVPEMNLGQMLREVQRLVPGATGYSKTNGEVITPAEVVAAAREVLA